MAMIPILKYPDYDGNRYSRSSSDVQVDGGAVRLPGTLSLEIHRKLTRGKSWASRSKPQTRTRGKAEFDAKIKMFVEDYNLYLNFLQAKGLPLGFGSFEVSHLITCTVFEPQLGTTRWDIIGASISDESVSPVEDSDDKEIEMALDLDTMDILKDGFSIVNEQSPFGQVGQNA